MLKDWKAFPPKQEQDKDVIFGKPKLFYSKSCNHLTFLFPPSLFFIHTSVSQSCLPYKIISYAGGSLILMFFFQPSFAPLHLPDVFVSTYLNSVYSSGLAQLLGGCVYPPPLFKLNCEHQQAVIFHTVLSVYNRIMGTNSLRVELFQGTHHCCIHTKYITNITNLILLQSWNFKHGGKLVKHTFDLRYLCPCPLLSYLAMFMYQNWGREKYIV